MCCFFTACVFWSAPGLLGLLAAGAGAGEHRLRAFQLPLAGGPLGPDLHPLDNLDVRDDLPLNGWDWIWLGFGIWRTSSATSAVTTNASGVLDIRPMTHCELLSNASEGDLEVFGRAMPANTHYPQTAERKMINTHRRYRQMIKHGPVDVIVLAAGEPRFDGGVLAELERQAASGTIRVLDAMILLKDEPGRAGRLDLEDLPAAEAAAVGFIETGTPASSTPKMPKHCSRAWCPARP